MGNPAPKWGGTLPARRDAAVVTQAPTALVVGGGIAGPAVAMALHKAGIQSVVYEAHPASAAVIR